MIRFWDFQLSGAPPLRSLVVRQERALMRAKAKGSLQTRRLMAALDDEILLEVPQ